MLQNNWKKTYKEKVLIFQNNSSFMYQKSNFGKCKACLKLGVGSLYTSCGIRSAEWQETKFAVHAGLLHHKAPATKCHAHEHNKRDTLFLQFLANLRLTQCSRWFFKPSMHYSPLRGLQCPLLTSNHHAAAFASSLECFQTKKFKINILKFNK